MTSPNTPVLGWTLDEWKSAYAGGALTVNDLVSWVEGLSNDDHAWITLIDPQRLRQQIERLEHLAVEAASRGDVLPLFGIPFAVKDNIDVAGLPTTAACPAFAYTASESATVVERLLRAGAIVVGKTNMDQFATGLVGTRSPYGAVPNPFNPAYICGGSSSGSAAVVARGMVPFALGTDTAGSGRVPAAFTNIVGLKPTRGALSTTGIVPACRTLDCPSVFALCVEDAALVADLAAGFDPTDAYSRRAPHSDLSLPGKHLAVPDQLSFFGDACAQSAFERTCNALSDAGATLERVDFSPFVELARLLYDGPWVAERYHVIESMLGEQPRSVHPVVRQIIERGKLPSAVDAFRAEYRRAELARVIDDSIAGFDALLVPTTPTIYRIGQVEVDPVDTNTRLGTYTNYTNLADLCGLALPGLFRDDGLPSGISLLAPAWHDSKLAQLGRWIQARLELPLGATGRTGALGTTPPPLEHDRTGDGVQVAVVGAHLSGMPLHHELTEFGAKFVSREFTSADYRLYALPGTQPGKPGLVRTGDGGEIELEIYRFSTASFGKFVANIPSPLGIGRIELSDGRWVQGFLCEAWATKGAVDITHYGGFRAYVCAVPSLR